MAGLFRRKDSAPASTPRKAAWLFGRLGAAKEAAGGLTQPEAPHSADSQDSAVRSAPSPGRYTPIGMLSCPAAYSPVVSQIRSQELLATPVLAMNLETPSSASDLSPENQHATPTAISSVEQSAREADLSRRDASWRRNSPGASYCASSETIPVAQSMLLHELRQAIFQLYREVEQAKGLPLGEGSFAMQALCGTIEQVDCCAKPYAA
ncbi:MAG: hypothetical protein SGPRY_012121, partial [Prymnesium sp.]